MVVFVLGVGALAVALATGEDAEPDPEPTVAPVDEGTLRSVPMLDGSTLAVTLPEPLADLEVAYLTANVTVNGSVRTQVTVFPLTWEAWRLTLAPSSTWDSDASPLRSGERLSATAQLFAGPGVDGVDSTYLVFNAGGAVAQVLVERAGQTVVPREALETLARSVIVGGDVNAPVLLVDPTMTTVEFPSTTLGSSQTQELVVTVGSCDPRQDGGSNPRRRCFGDAGVSAALWAPGQEAALDDVVVTTTSPAVDRFNEPAVRFFVEEGWQRSRPGEAATDLAERALSEVFRDPGIAVGARDLPGGRTIVTLETDSGSTVDAEISLQDDGLVLRRLSSPGLRRVSDSTFESDGPGTLTVAGRPSAEGYQEIFVEGVLIGPGNVAGPLEFPESSWIDATLTTRENRLLHLFEAR